MNLYIGDAFAGDKFNTVQINVVLGPRTGPVGSAWTAAFASTATNHLLELQPGAPVKPFTLVVNKAALAGEQQDRMSLGPAQAGVAKGIQECLLEGVLPSEAENEWCVLVALSVNPRADNAPEVYANSYKASKDAVVNALGLLPLLSEVREAAANIRNTLYSPEEA